VAVYVSFEDDDRLALERQWKDMGIDVPLEIIPSPYRDLVGPLERYIDELDARWDNDTVTVVIPEFVVGKWYEQLLHNQSALLLKAKLLFREGTVVTSVPYHLNKPGDRQESYPGMPSSRSEGRSGPPSRSEGRSGPPSRSEGRSGPEPPSDGSTKR
jgi:hypothetical protein